MSIVIYILIGFNITIAFITKPALYSHADYSTLQPQNNPNFVLYSFLLRPSSFCIQKQAAAFLDLSK